MQQKMNTDEQRITTLLTLRDCVTSSPATLARALEIHRTTARYRIQVLQEEGFVRGYTPIVMPTLFGKPYLVKIRIDPKQYQFEEDLQTTLTSLKEYFQSGIGHAPLSVYSYRQDKMWAVHCITTTKNVDKLCDSIYDADGIPGYSMFSLGEAEEDWTNSR